MRGAFLVIVIIVSVLVAMQFFGGAGGGGESGGGQGKPAIFSDELTLTAANAKASSEGKLVLVMATADWCPPCQQMKKGTLRDSGVEAIVREKFLPVYLDVTDEKSPGVVDAKPLNVSGIPAFIVMKGGQEIARTVGAMSPADFSDFLRSSAK
jgi:thiol:disulfide interchange protein